VSERDVAPRYPTHGRTIRSTVNVCSTCHRDLSSARRVAPAAAGQALVTARGACALPIPAAEVVSYILPPRHPPRRGTVQNPDTQRPGSPTRLATRRRGKAGQ
jgi:hypothetical protein